MHAAEIMQKYVIHKINFYYPQAQWNIFKYVIDTENLRYMCILGSEKKWKIILIKICSLKNKRKIERTG